MHIKVFQEGDDYIWIPVAKGKTKNTARPFLPFKGIEGKYRHGYKAAPLEDKYTTAIKSIQTAYLNDERKTFKVNKAKNKNESQHKARWRNCDEKNAPLLSPSLGWINIKMLDIKRITDEWIYNHFKNTEKKYIDLSKETIEEMLLDREKLILTASKIPFQELTPPPRGKIKPIEKKVTITQYYRDPKVVAYILKESNGKCECCGRNAPFQNSDGYPYLEVHHVEMLASGGRDTIDNTIAICPNCHKELHYGKNAHKLKDELYKKISRLKNKLDTL